MTHQNTKTTYIAVRPHQLPGLAGSGASPASTTSPWCSTPPSTSSSTFPAAAPSSRPYSSLSECCRAPNTEDCRVEIWQGDEDKDIEEVAFFSDLFSDKAFEHTFLKSVRVLRCFENVNQYHSYNNKHIDKYNQFCPGFLSDPSPIIVYPCH